MRLGYSTWGMPDVPIERAVAHCAGLGFDALELAVIPGWVTDAATLGPADRRRIRELYDDHGIALSGLIGNTPVLVSEAEWPTERAAFETYLDLAAELGRGGERLTVSCTSGGEHSDWERARELLAARFGELAALADERDVGVTVEPHVACALHRPEHARWLLERVGSPALGVTLDISHFNVQGIEMEAAVAQLGPLAATSHVKDERGRWPAFEFLIPGEGEMDYARYLRALSDAGFDGTVAVEISVFVQRRPGYDALSAATTSYRVLADAFVHAGIERQVR
jgi:sugar phosphate isomerase/epimerase